MHKITKVISAVKSGRSICITECGGGSSNTGHARIISMPDGNKPFADYIPKRGSLSNADHAYIPAVLGWYVIESNHHRNDSNIYVWKIIDVNPSSMGITLELVDSFEKGAWKIDSDNINILNKAITACIKKSQDYHCRIPYYVEND